jgi:hypothetical protein
VALAGTRGAPTPWRHLRGERRAGLSGQCLKMSGQCQANPDRACGGRGGRQEHRRSPRHEDVNSRLHELDRQFPLALGRAGEGNPILQIKSLKSVEKIRGHTNAGIKGTAGAARRP